MRRMAACLVAFLLILQAVVTVSAEESALLENDSVHLGTRVPFATVQARCAGGTDYLDKFGVTRKALLAELTAHEHDNYYLGTPWIGGDWQSPRGDASYNGRAGMNCAGFVAYVLRKCGLNSTAAINAMKSGKPRYWGTGRPYDLLAGASNYMSLVEKGGLIAYAFESREALLASGKCEKGDLVLRFWTDSFSDGDADNHLMIYWGSDSHENKVWNSTAGRNHIGPIAPGYGASFVLIKFAPLAPPVAGFTDVREDDWFAGAVQYVKEKDLMSGTSDVRFSPSGFTTRGQLVSILWRLSGKLEAAAEGSSFPDVDPEKYYAPAIAWAAGQSIVSGYPSGDFCPEKRVSRQELAVILRNYCAARGISTQVEEEDFTLAGYEDFPEIGDFAVEAMEWAKVQGLISGVSETRLVPQGSATRAQTASVLQRFCQNVLKLPEEETGGEQQ